MTNDVAIFLDLDNLVIGAKQINIPFDINLILDKVKELTGGRIVLRHAYGAGRQSKHLLQELAEAGFVVQSATRTSNFSKNLADMQIVVNAMDTIIDGHQYNNYVLISGDSDFTPLVQSLRKRGKRVIGVGIKHTTSSSLEELCDEYVYYEDLLPSEQLPPEELESLLIHARNELLQKKGRIQASILNQKMMDLSQGAFKSSSYPEGNFRKFLEQNQNIVHVIQDGTTLYVTNPRRENGEAPLHLRYRSALKKHRLRIVPANQRFIVLKDLTHLLISEKNLVWRETLDKLTEKYEREQRSVSKNIINAVLLAARAGKVIKTQKGKSLSSAPVQLELTGEKIYQRAIVQCDAAYLNEIQKLPLPFDLQEASLALYESENYAPYLRRILNTAHLVSVK